MANAVTLIPATIMAEAYETAKIEFGVCEGAGFYQSRPGAKEKLVVRSELGVAMSGNKEERANHVAHIALKLWAQSKYSVIAGELLRVFPKLRAEVEARNAAVNTVLADAPELADKLKMISIGNPGKFGVMAMFALAQGLTGAEKGEKAKLLAAGAQINAYELAAQGHAERMMLEQTATTSN